MWTCSQLKNQAKQALNDRYLPVFVVCLLAGLVGGDFFSDLSGHSQGVVDLWKSGNFPLAVAGSLGLLLLYLLVSLPMRVGRNHYLLENRRGRTPIRTMFSVYRRNFPNVFKIMVLQQVRIVLWSCLLVVPGILKALEYSMVPYLLAQDPDLSAERAFALSRAMTQGQKLHIFWLGLTFLGWYLAIGALDTVLALAFSAQVSGLLAVGAIALLQPYVQATLAELFCTLEQSVAAAV